MQLKIASYSFDANGSEITTRSDIFRNEAGVPYKYKAVMDVKGYLSISGSTPAAMQSDCTSKMNALISALNKPYKDIIFYDDSGSPTATKLVNTGSLTGVVVTRGPNFPDGIHGYTNVQRFEFEAEAEYYLPASSGVNVGTLLVSFTESLSFSGGLPRRILKESISAFPQTQITCLHTIFRVTQHGQAVGVRAYPNIPPPIWPAALLESPDIQEQGPKRRGLRNYEDFGITWSYKFGSPTPLVGVPTLWKG